MATLRDAIEWAKQNPETDQARRLYDFIVTGAADDRAREEQIDLAPFGRPRFDAELTLPSIQAGEDRQSFMERVRERLGERRRIVSEEILPAQQTPFETAFQTVGQAAGLTLDIGGELVVSAARNILKGIDPEKPAVKWLKKFASKAAEDFSQGDIAEFLRQHEEAKKASPEYARKARNIESIINLGGLALEFETGAVATKATRAAAETGIKAGRAVLKGTAKVGKEITKETIEKARVGTGTILGGLRKQAGELGDKIISFIETGTFKGVPDDVSKFIDQSLDKAIRPPVTGKATSIQIETYKKSAREAVVSVVDNKNNLKFLDEAGEEVSRLPQSLREFGDAISQTKEQIFKQYDSLAKQAGEQGASVNLAGVADELDNVASNKVLVDNRPDVVQYANQKAKALRARKSYTAEEAQEAIKLYNAQLDAFYRNPTVENANKVAIDAMIANRMRKSLNEVIEGITGEQYQALKGQYGSLKTIEKNVARRTIIEARKNAKGLIDYTDIFSAGDIVRGVITMDPTFLAKGGFQFALKSFYKRWVSPDSTIKRMFDALDKNLQ